MILLMIGLFPACSAPEVKEDAQHEPITKAEVQVAVKDTEVLHVKSITYHLFLSDSVDINAIIRDSVYNNIICMLNRTDVKHLSRIDSLLLPDTLVKYSDYCPFPVFVQSIASVHKLVVVSYRMQLFAAFEDGSLVRYGQVNMGKRSTPTPTGLFYTNWKAKRTISTIDSSWIMNWYFNLENYAGVSMHEYDLPGYPASHACIRMTHDDAMWMYYWAEQWILQSNEKIAEGTPVIIYGDYPFGSRRPWRNLADDPDYFINETKVLDSLFSFYLPDILKEEEKRKLKINAVL